MSADAPLRKLSDDEISQRLQALNGWERHDDAISRAFRAKDFRAAQTVINRICDLAEGANHHPTIHWTYADVQIELNTHDAGGITQKDFALAAVIDTLLP